MTIIKTTNSNNVFKRKHDGFIFGNEIKLGKDFSTGVERDDLAEYYEEVRNPAFPIPPTPTGYKILIPEYWEALFPEDKFIIGEFEAQLERNVDNDLLVDIAYLQWTSFREELLKPENATLARQMGAVMRFLEQQALNNNLIVSTT